MESGWSIWGWAVAVSIPINDTRACGLVKGPSQDRVGLVGGTVGMVMRQPFFHLQKHRQL